MSKIALIVLLCAALPIYAWGPEGHDLVARIAEAQLTPEVHAKVVAILGPGVSMASVASWADSIRRDRPETGVWHYVDIPIDKPHRDMARDCPKGNCVVQKIEDFEAVLRDPNAPATQRREALMFVIHFIGDMHQPLHSSDDKDKGGNDKHVVFDGRNMNLHSLWDGGLLGPIGKEDDLFPTWSAEAARHARKWSKGSVEDWAEQSHKAAVKIVYGNLPKTTDKTKPYVIDAAYVAKADPLIKDQIEKAGDRLARALNQNVK
jgi:S1/P1 Nuclease